MVSKLGFGLRSQFFVGWFWLGFLVRLSWLLVLVIEVVPKTTSAPTSATKSIFPLLLDLKLLLFEEFILVFGNVFKQNIAVSEQNFVLVG